MADNDALAGVLDELARTLVDGAWVFVFCDDDTLPLFRRFVEESFTYRKALIWDTQRMGLGHYFRSRHGFILAATNGDTERYVRNVPTVLQAPAPQREPGKSDTYPTAKPPALVDQFLSPVVEPGERVLEPFCGSAPTLPVARSHGLEYWGIDRSPDALSRARNRGGQSTLSEVTEA
jgi:DNA modification methylase